MCENQSIGSLPRPRLDDRFQLPETLVQERLLSPTEGNARQKRRVSPRRSLGLDDETGLLELKRKLSEVESHPTRPPPDSRDRIAENDQETSRFGDCDVITSSGPQNPPHFRHLLTTSPVRDFSLVSSSSTQATAVSRSSRTVTAQSDARTKQLTPTTSCAVVVPDDVTLARDVTGACRSWKRQVSYPQGEPPVVEEISSEQWGELLLRPAPLTSFSSAIIQEVDTDEGSDAGSVQTPDTPPRITEAHIIPSRALTTASSPGVHIVEEETLHFAAEEQELWGEEEWTQENEGLRSPVPEHGSPGVMLGASERALFSMLRPYGSVLRPTLGCLSPMTEEEEEQTDWGLSSAGVPSSRAVSPELEDDVFGVSEASDQESSTIWDTVSEKTRWTVPGCLTLSDEQTGGVCGELPCNAVSQNTAAGVEKTFSESLPVETRGRGEGDSRGFSAEAQTGSGADVLYTRKSWSLPNETREREIPNHTKREFNRQNQNSSNGEEPRNIAENTVRFSQPSLQVSTTGSETVITSELLPNSAITREELGDTREGDHAELRSTSISDSISEATISVSLPSTVRVPDNRAGNHKTVSMSLPNEAHKSTPEQQTSTIDSLNSARLKDSGNVRLMESLTNETKESRSSPSGTEVIDRTDDKKYDFRALRMKRQQAQQAKKTKKEERLRRKHDSHDPQSCAEINTAENTEDRKSNKKRTDTYNEPKIASNTNQTAVISEENRSGCSKPSRYMTEINLSRSNDPENSKETLEIQGNFRKSTSRLQRESKLRVPTHEEKLQILTDFENEFGWLSQTKSGAESQSWESDERTAEKPSLVTKLEDIECFMTETLVLEVETKGHPTPLAQWFFKPFLSDESPWTSVNTYMDGAALETGGRRLLQQKGHRFRLVVGRLHYQDAGLFKVTLENPAGQVSSQCKVTVKPISEVSGPTFFSPLVDQIVAEGESAIFRVEVHGKPPPEVTWYKDDVKLHERQNCLMSENPESGEFCLRFLSTIVEDEGCYVCRATNKHGTTDLAVDLRVTTAASAELRTKIGPVFTRPLRPLYHVTQGQTIVLEVVLSSRTPYKTAWWVNGRPLEFSERVATSEDADGTERLTVVDAGADDAGRYQLMVEKEDGSRNVTTADVIVRDIIDGDIQNTIGNTSSQSTHEASSAGSLAAEQERCRREPQPLPVPAGVPVPRGAERSLEMEADEAAVEEMTAPEDSHPEEEAQATHDSEAPASAHDQSPETEQAHHHVKDTTPARTPDRRSSSATSDAARRRSSATSETSRRRSSAAADAEPPAIEVALTGVHATAGCPGRLEGKVSGRPRPTISWSRDGTTVVADGERVRCYHEEDGTFGLEIAECLAEDAGLYEATAANAHGSAATDAQLQLGDMSVSGKEWAPDFTTPLLGGTFDEGGTIELDTHVTGVPIPEITWSKDGVPLDADDRVTLTFDSDKAKLSIADVSTSDAGIYEISIQNKLGEVYSSVEVKIKKVYQTPTFTQGLSDVQQLPGLDAKFACKVSGIPAPEVHWLRSNGEVIKSGRKCKIRRDEDSCTMSVRECEEEDAGQYICRASNREGSVDSTAMLQVVEKLDRKPRSEAPLFLKTLGDCEVFPGMQARFTACVAGYPEPEAEWFRNDVRLYPSERVLMEADGTGLVRLTLRTVDETDAGRYRLTVRNSEGAVSCQADLTYDSFELLPSKPLMEQYHTLEKELKSGIPTQLADPPIISKMVDRQLTLSWKPSATAGQRIPPTYIVEMAKMPDGEFTIVHHGVRGCSVEIKRLESHCDYKFRVVAENKHGTSEPSPHVIAHRRELVPPPEDEHPTLPDGEPFRPGSSAHFPRGFDMEKYTGARPHPPTGESPRQANGKAADEEDGSWRYERFDPDVSTARLASQRLVKPFPASYHPPANVPSSAERPPEPHAPSARLRHMTDDVDGYVPTAGGRPRRQAHGEEWEQQRGSNIIERLLVRKQMEEAAKSFTRSAGLDTRGVSRLVKQRPDKVSDRMAAIERRLNRADDDDAGTPAMRRSPMPVRSPRPVLSDDDDELDSPSLYSRSRYPQSAVDTRPSPRARSILDEDDDDDDIMTSYRRPAYHARTASLVAAANNETNDDDDFDITPYLRRPPRLLGTRDWGAKPARSAAPVVSAMEREFQERRERHAEMISSRSCLPQTTTSAPAVTDWQSEFDRYMKGVGTARSTASASNSTHSKPVKPTKDLTSAGDWESRFNAV